MFFRWMAFARGIKVFPPVVVSPSGVRGPIFVCAMDRVFHHLLLFTQSFFLCFLRVQPSIRASCFVPVNSGGFPVIFHYVQSRVGGPPMSNSEGFVPFVTTSRPSLVVIESRRFYRTIVVSRLFRRKGPPYPFAMFRVVVDTPRCFYIFFDGEGQQL